MSQPRIVYDLLAHAAATFAGLPAMHQPLPGRGETKYQTYSWLEYRDAVNEIAVGLRALGVQKGDLVAISSETRAEFYLADFGAMTAGAISAALYTSYPAATQAQTLDTLRPKVVLAENPKTLAGLREGLSDPDRFRWVLLTGEAPGAATLDAVRRQGRELLAQDRSRLDQLLAEVTPADPAMLYLTSGATGEPKMGLVSHAAIVANVEIATEALHLTPQDRTVVFLPSAHITQRLALEVLPCAYGMPVWFSESLNKFPNELKRVKPTFLVAPPRVWERIYSRISTEVQKKPAYSRKLFYGALGAGSKAAKLRVEGQPVPGWLNRIVKLADKAIFSKVRQQFGGEIRVAVSGSAPLSKELGLFYQAIGMPIVEGYGLTEGGITCLNPLDRPRLGTIGNLLPRMEAKISGDGELLLRGPCLFSGYYRDPAATAQVLRDGWLHTGDIAEIDAEGFIYITGRKKEVIVASNGKKIYPARVENLFKTEPLVSHVVLVGDKLPYVAALFTLNPSAVEALNGKPVEDEVKRAVARINKQLAPFEQIRKFRVLDREFTIDAGELTPTMKVRRTKVLENYHNLVSEMYAGKEEFA